MNILSCFCLFCSHSVKVTLRYTACTAHLFLRSSAPPGRWITCKEACGVGFLFSPSITVCDTEIYLKEKKKGSTGRDRPVSLHQEKRKYAQGKIKIKKECIFVCVPKNLTSFPVSCSSCSSTCPPGVVAHTYEERWLAWQTHIPST